MTDRKIFFTTIALILFALSVLAIFNCCFFTERLFHPATKQRPREFNAIIARYYDYDSIILGSSLSLNFRCADFDDAVGGFSYNLAISGGHIEEIVFTGRYAAKYRKLKNVLLDLHPHMLCNDRSFYFFPFELYDDSLYRNRLQEYISIKTTRETFAYLSELKNGVKISRDNIYGDPSPHTPGKATFARIFFHPPASSDVKQEVVHDIRFAEINLKKYLIPFINENRQTRFIIFLPPLSGLYYENTDEMLHTRKVIMDLLLPLKNVELYDFQSESNICNNLDLYYDTTHFSGSVHHWILQCVKQKKDFVTFETRPVFEQKFLDFIRTIPRQAMIDELKRSL